MSTDTEHEKEISLDKAAESEVASVTKVPPGEKPQASCSSNDRANQADRIWDIPTLSAGTTATKLVLGVAATGIVAAVLCFLAGYVSNSFNLSPEQYGVFLALLSVVAGGVIGYADPRPKLIKQLTKVHDEEAKAIALRAKTDAGWCTVGMACFGVPAILARIYPPAALNFVPHNVTAGFVAGAVLTLAFGTAISLRTNGAEFARQVLKMRKRNEDLQKKLDEEKKLQEKLEAGKE